MPNLAFPQRRETKRDADKLSQTRARMLIMRGYKPKVPWNLCFTKRKSNTAKIRGLMEKARADAEDFLLKVRKGLI